MNLKVFGQIQQIWYINSGNPCQMTTVLKIKRMTNLESPRNHQPYDGKPENIYLVLYFFLLIFSLFPFSAFQWFKICPVLYSCFLQSLRWYMSNVFFSKFPKKTLYDKLISTVKCTSLKSQWNESELFSIGCTKKENRKENNKWRPCERCTKKGHSAYFILHFLGQS